MLAADKEVTRIFTANVSSNSVSGIEVTGMGRYGLADWNQTVIPVKTQPHGIAISPDGQEVWVGGRLDGHFTIIDAATKAVLHTMDAPSWRAGERMAFTPDGKRVLIPNSGENDDTGGGEVVVFDVAARKEIKRIPIGHGSSLEEVIIPPDGATAYVADAHENSVVIIDLKTLAVTGRIPVGPAAVEGMAWASAQPAE